MNNIPIFAFAGYSGSGKTTIIEKVVLYLKSKGIKVAVLKHDGHDFDIDTPGKDSYRFSKAGADISLINSSTKTAYMENRPLSLSQVLSRIHDVDVIIVEGYKNEKLPQIGICRTASGKGFTSDSLNRYIAIMSDADNLNTTIPCFALDETAEISEFIMKNLKDFTHFNEQGRAKMVDVGEKEKTQRTAYAAARVLVNKDTFALISSGGMKKGDVLTVAQIAGVMGAKRTPDLIPMCHPIIMDGIDLTLFLDEERLSVEIFANVSCEGRTGIEMESLTAVSVAALTVYDMCKAVQKDIVITDIRLIRKTGGMHGDFERSEQ